MKIAILTLPLHTNYGGILQAYALQTVLERMGHDVCILSRRESKPNLKLQIFRILSFLKSLFRRYFLNDTDFLIVSPFVENYCTKNRIDCFKLREFVANYLNLTSPLRSLNQMIKYAQKEQLDIYIVGSDQVWREEYVQSIEEMFLSFLPKDCKAKRIAYAASFGTNDNPISSEKLSACVDLLQRFNAVSVREKSAVDMCEDIFGVEADHVLDPTMLLTAIDYKTIFEKAAVQKSPGTLLTYILDEDHCIKRKIEQLAKDMNLVPFSVNTLEKVESFTYAYRQPSIECWLRGFYDSELVVTDSFHACVFSIIFNKPFVCIGNKDRGNARFDSLLDMFGLQDRLVDDMNSNLVLHKTIDWRRVNEILEQKRYESFAFLRKVL